MSFVTYDGIVAANPHAGTQTYHLLLAIASLTDTLILSEFGDNPYQYWREGYPKSEGRSMTGGIRITGSHPPKRRWDLAFHATDAMAALFEGILGAQSPTQPTTMVDAWSAPGNYSVWLDVADKWRTPIGAGIHLLQFSAREV